MLFKNSQSESNPLLFCYLLLEHLNVESLAVLSSCVSLMSGGPLMLLAYIEGNNQLLKKRAVLGC